MRAEPAAGRGALVVAVIGGGPAGLMAAEQLAAAGAQVHLYDAMPSVGRKFLLAGKGGLNLTHGEPEATFGQRYFSRSGWLAPWLAAFGPQALRDWAAGLGVETFVGSSGRVFPRDLKAAPLLRAWLQRLRGQGVQLHMRHRWLGWDEAGALRLATPQGEAALNPAATVLALGGASWQRLGSDGAWWPVLQAAALPPLPLVPLRPSNCGFDVAWSKHLVSRHAGAPLKGVALCFGSFSQKGEAVLTATGIEGSLVYAASSLLREALAAGGPATFTLDLLPQREQAWVRDELARPRGPRSLATHLKTRLKIDGAKAALVWECVPKVVQADPAQPGRAAEGAAGDGAGAQAHRRGHQHRRRRTARGAGRTPDAAPAPGRVLRRRDAGLGGAHRRLPAHRVLGQRPLGGAGRSALAGPAAALRAARAAPRWAASPGP